MNRQHHISLREEFDEHDGSESKYIVLLDDTYPIATCRFYALDKQSVLLGRVVVLPEYRGKHLGSRVIREAEKWIAELLISIYGYEKAEKSTKYGYVSTVHPLNYAAMKDTYQNNTLLKAKG